MKYFLMVITCVMVLAGCGDQSGINAGKENEKDSASTDAITDPSYNPKVEADSAAKQMNLDSTELKDSANKLRTEPN